MSTGRPGSTQPVSRAHLQLGGKPLLELQDPELRLEGVH